MRTHVSGASHYLDALKRIAGLVPTLFALCTLSFFVIRLAPGGPFDAAQARTPAMRANLEAAYGLDRPPGAQYLLYLRGLLHGDFGRSLSMRDVPVADLIRAALPLSVTLGSLALLLAICCGVPLGVCAATAPGRACERSSALLAAVALGVPNFVLAPFFALLFGVYLRWLPVAGWSGAARELVLPVITLALPIAATLARLTQAGMADVLRQPYVRTARAKGISPARVLVVHVLPPALAPAVSYLGPAVAFALTGSLVIETIFGLPGSGRYLVQGAINRDYPLVMGMVIVYGALTLVCNLAADLCLTLLDRRAHAS